MHVVVLAVILLASTAASPIKVVTDVPYVEDQTRAHQLDLYLPSEPAHAPLLVFVHGGAFIDGDRRQYHAVGESLASQGIATALVSYRLYPQADALGAMQDVARAVAWISANENRYGVDAHQILLAGHSAGGQIVSELATDGSLLRDAGVSVSNLCGVISDAGIYDVRDLSGEPDWMERADEKIYGATPQLRARVSPQMYVSAASPPMLVACGTDDDPDGCGRALRFVRALNAVHGSAILLREIGADHMGMLRNLMDPRDALNQQLHSMARSCN